MIPGKWQNEKNQEPASHVDKNFTGRIQEIELQYSITVVLLKAAVS